ncbi:hypothetical protein, partial [Nitrosomonas sp. Is37]|uniref:hypothetical protein n=1 Tax=Nitrosomonas sp. Is37 TaxID=3080535 RepID=UPI00294AE506
IHKMVNVNKQQKSLHQLALTISKQFLRLNPGLNILPLLNLMHYSLCARQRLVAEYDYLIILVRL